MPVNIRSPSVVLELPGKFAGDVVDHVVDLTGYLDATASLTDPSVELDAGNGESPVAMTVEDCVVVAPESGQPATKVKFWLSGGTPGVRYRGTILFSEEPVGSPPPPTVTRRRLFYVVVS